MAWLARRALRAWIAAFALFVGAGCESVPATQVVVHFDAETMSKARATHLRIRVWDADGMLRFERELELGETAPLVQLPVNLPLVPRGGRSGRTFSVEGALLEDRSVFSLQRVTGGYQQDRLVHVNVLFEDACMDQLACMASETCHGGRCIDACLSPSPDDCTPGPVGCGDCSLPTDGGCMPAPDGTACTGGGTCRAGACCTGCWDGMQCQPGDTARLCGVGGSGCFDCPCPANECSAGICQIPETLVDVHTGGTSTCALGPDGRLWCWGTNAMGELGLGDTMERTTPEALDGNDWAPLCRSAAPTTHCAQIALGLTHACVIRGAGALYCWGSNALGELGLGMAGDPVLVPTRVEGTTAWIALGAGLAHTCGIQSDGSLWCWGRGNNGQLGTGDAMNRPTPTRVGMDSNWVQVVAGESHTCARKMDNTIWCWGANGYGQLGAAAASNVPQRIAGTRTYTDLAAGRWHVCAVANDGAMMCWGRNDSGQIGQALTVVEDATPTRVGTSNDWAFVGAGERTTCAIQTDGELFCWGESGEGQVGNGSTTDRVEPIKVNSWTDWKTISLGNLHVCGVREDSTAWCWGDNDLGQLGSGGTSTRRTRPGGVCMPVPER